MKDLFKNPDGEEWLGADAWMIHGPLTLKYFVELVSDFGCTDSDALMHVKNLAGIEDYLEREKYWNKLYSSQ